MFKYTKRQVSVLLEEAEGLRGSRAGLARYLNLSTSALARAFRCRSTEAPLPPSVVVRLKLRTARDMYAAYESDLDLRDLLGLPDRPANENSSKVFVTCKAAS